MSGHDDANRGLTPEEHVHALRYDISEALAALVRLQPHLATLETSEELEGVLGRFRGYEQLIGSRATARDLALAEVAFVNLNSDNGDLELATRCIDELARYGEAMELELDDVNTLIRAQLLGVLAHLREGERARTLASITAFEHAVSRYSVPGDRELVERVKEAASGARPESAIEAVRDKLLWLFAEDIAFLGRITRRTSSRLLDLLSGVESSEK